MMTLALKHGCTEVSRLDSEVKQTIKRIFEHLRKQQPQMRPRESDRVNVDQMLREHRNRNTRRD